MDLLSKEVGKVCIYENQNDGRPTFLGPLFSTSNVAAKRSTCQELFFSFCIRVGIVLKRDKRLW